MNQEQVVGLIRQALPLLAGIAISQGWLDAEQAADLSDKTIMAVGALVALGSAVWSFRSKTDKAIVEKAIALPEVNRIETAPTPEGVKLARTVTDENVVVQPNKPEMWGV